MKRFQQRLRVLEQRLPPAPQSCVLCAPLTHQHVWLSREPAPWDSWPLVRQSGTHRVYQCPGCGRHWPVETVRIAPQLTPPPSVLDEGGSHGTE
jgi:hypothetical protein